MYSSGGPESRKTALAEGLTDDDPESRSLTSDAMARTTWSVELRSLEETEQFAEAVAEFLRAGDLVTLAGELGVGKTTFARALIRHLAEEPELEVPSPTFTLMQLYRGADYPIVHADLYRIRSPDELAELGWDEAADGALVIVEWAQRSGDRLPVDRLDIAFDIDAADPENARKAVVTGHGDFASRIAAIQAINGLLAEAGFAGASRSFLTGDASTRAYERLTRPDGRTALLMISPPRADAPVVRFGKPYYEIAHLAADIRPYLALGPALRGEGISAPAILAQDAEAGLAIIEDLGDTPVTDADGPIADRYLEAVALLARLHSGTLPSIVPVGNSIYAIPDYDLDALLIEAELVIDWYAPSIAKVAVPASGRASFMATCTRLFDQVLAEPATWCLRGHPLEPRSTAPRRMRGHRFPPA